MNQDETSQDELARLQTENARLRAMIDRLERRGGDEPAPPATDTQIIRAEPEPLPARARSSERPKRVRKRRKREREEVSLFQGCLPSLLIVGSFTAAYAGLLILSIALSDGLHLINFWGGLFFALIGGPLILGIIEVFIVQVREQRARQQAHAALLKKRAEQRAERRRRITRKLRPIITQKLDERGVG